MINYVPLNRSLSLLDIATGTGDQLFTLMHKRTNIHQATGVDLAEDMLAIAKTKARLLPFHSKISFQKADALHMPFDNETFDVLTLSFGLRNMLSIEKCLQEMYRVLKSQGTLLILEFALPKLSFLRKSYLFYLRHILPHIGRWISKHHYAYTYLNKTIETFPHGNPLCDIIRSAQFQHVTFKPLTLGAVNLYIATKC